MNFNLKNNEYNLQKNIIDEFIKLYGIEVLFVFKEKNINSIFGDFEYNKDLYSKKIFVIPADNGFEGYNNGLDYAFNNFGVIGEDNLDILVAIDNFKDENFDISNLISNMIIFPNSKKMEITNATYYTPKLSNMYLYNNQPNCIKLSLKVFNEDKEQNEKVLENIEEVKQFASKDELFADDFNLKIKNAKLNDIFK